MHLSHRYLAPYDSCSVVESCAGESGEKTEIREIENERKVSVRQNGRTCVGSFARANVQQPGSAGTLRAKRLSRTVGCRVKGKSEIRRKLD